MKIEIQISISISTPYNLTELERATLKVAIQDDHFRYLVCLKLTSEIFPDLLPGN